MLKNHQNVAHFITVLAVGIVMLFGITVFGIILTVLTGGN